MGDQRLADVAADRRLLASYQNALTAAQSGEERDINEKKNKEGGKKGGKVCQLRSTASPTLGSNQELAPGILLAVYIPSRGAGVGYLLPSRPGYQPPPPLATAADARVWWIRLGGGDIRWWSGGPGVGSHDERERKREEEAAADATVAGGCVCVRRGGGMCWATG